MTGEIAEDNLAEDNIEDNNVTGKTTRRNKDTKRGKGRGGGNKGRYENDW